MKYLGALLLVVTLALNGWADDGYVVDALEGKVKAYAIEPQIMVTRHVIKPTGRSDGMMDSQVAWNLLATIENSHEIIVYYRWYLLEEPVPVSEFIPNEFQAMYNTESRNIKYYLHRLGGLDLAITYLKAWAVRNVI